MTQVALMGDLDLVQEHLNFEEAFRAVKKYWIGDLDFHMRRNSLQPDKYYESEVITAWEMWLACARFKLNSTLAKSNSSLVESNPDEVVAWLVPELLTFEGCKKVSFFRTEEGAKLTDEQLKESITGSVIWRAETVFFNDGNVSKEGVKDRDGVVHFPKQLEVIEPNTVKVSDADYAKMKADVARMDYLDNGGWKVLLEPEQQGKGKTVRFTIDEAITLLK